jgi:hypothetical protein
MRQRALLTLVVAVLALSPAARAYVDGAWLDEPLAPWNTTGMAIPSGPPRSSAGLANDRQCGHLVRPAETAADVAVAEAGWMLLGPYQHGWGVTLVTATNDWDGMCRPAGYQGFVFVDGAFAGTVAPSPTFARTDGALRDLRLSNASELFATFVRYAETDPLCCPSRGTSMVSYRIDRSDIGAVLVPVDVYSSRTLD